MTQTFIYLVRHGQTRSNATGYYMGWLEEDLDETGRQQTQRLSSRMASFPVAAVYSSPLQRALSTALLIAQPHKLKPLVDCDITEIHIGDWQGMHRDEIQRRWPELWRQSRIDPSDITLPHGESFPQVTVRAVRAFNRIAQAHNEQRVVMITHDVIIRLVTAYVLGVSNSIYRRLDINNSSLTTIRIDDGVARLVTLNDGAHLERDSG